MLFCATSPRGAVFLALLALCASLHLALAARKVEINENQDTGSNAGTDESGDVQRRAITSRIVSRLNLGANVDIKPEDSLLSVQGNKKKKYSETYKGYKVFNTGLDVEEDGAGEVSIVAGDVYADIEGDLGSVSHCEIAETRAKAIALKTFNLDASEVNIVREAYEDYVYIDSGSTARWAVDVELSLFLPGGKFSRPVVFIDVCSQQVLDFFDRSGYFALTTDFPWDDNTNSFTDGPTESNTGGPTNSYTDGPTNSYTDGPLDDSNGDNGGSDTVTDGATDAPTNAPTNPPPTNAPTNPPTNAPTNSPTQSPTNKPPGKCDVVDRAGNPKREVKFGPGEEFCLGPMRRSADGVTCYLQNQYVKTVDLKGSEDDSSTTIAKFKCSEGYDDAKNGGFSPVLDAFFFCTASSRLYREWYNFVTLNNPIPYAKAHFGTDYVNAYWDGRSMVFGDGDGVSFYPLTGLDTAAHELGHGVTEKASNLIYRGQSGGMNEAFSDMAGEVTEQFLFGKSDMVSGAEMFFAPNKALRYFDDPTKDGSSIKHIKDYRRGMDVHYSSGLYNHVFYKITNAIGIRSSFQCFLTANRLYWRSDTDFEKGACGVIRGAYDGGFDMEVVAEAFKSVGLTLSQCSNRGSFVTARLKAGITQKDLIVSDIINPLFKIEVPTGASLVTVFSPDGLSVSLSTSYKRDDPVLSNGIGSVSAGVGGGQVIYARFYRGVPTRLTGATATVAFV